MRKKLMVLMMWNVLAKYIRTLAAYATPWFQGSILHVLYYYIKHATFYIFTCVGKQEDLCKNVQIAHSCCLQMATLIAGENYN